MQNYDRYYEILDLPPGAALDDIQRAWRLKAQIHPDTFVDGALKEAAERKLALVNNARDELRKWWQANGCPPPTFKRPVGAPAAKREAPGAAGESAQDRAATGTQAPPTAKPGGPAQPPPRRQPEEKEEPPKYPRPAKPFGPPAFKKTLKHRIYDWCLRPDSVAAAFVVWPLGLVASILPAYLVACLISALTGVPLSSWTEDWRYRIAYTLMWIAAGVAFVYLAGNDFSLYQELENPFVDMAPIDAATAIKRLEDALAAYSFQAHKWSLNGIEFGADGYAITAHFKLGRSQTTLHARTLPASEHGFALVTFWFEVKPPSLNKVAEYNLVRQTAEALRSSMGR